MSRKPDLFRSGEHVTKMTRERIKTINFLKLTIAGIVNAFGVTIFLFPMKLYDSGISGLSMLLDQITPASFTLSLFLIVINFPIFLFGIKKQGITFTIYSIFTIAIYSITSYLIMNVIPIDVNIASPLAGEDLILCAIFGGVISGVGSGLTIRFGGAIDGIDVLSVTFAKRLGISIGTFNMIFNAILYIVCGIILSSWILPLYSVVTYFIGSKTVDYIVEGFNRSKCAMIISNKSSEINQRIQVEFNSSGTMIKALGGYSQEEKGIIYFVVNTFTLYKLKQLVQEVDPGAFISIMDVSEIVKAK